MLFRSTTLKKYLLSGGGAPVGRSGNSQSCTRRNNSRDKHGLVTRQDSLAPGHGGTTLIDSLNGTSARDTVRLALERLLNLTVLVTVETSVLRRVSWDVLS